MDSILCKPTHGRFQDLTGHRFGRLTVVGYLKRESKRSLWSCICDCGNKKAVWPGSLKSGNSKSCGCLQKEISSEKNSNALAREVVFLETTVEIPLSGGGVTIVDRDDYDLVKSFRWWNWKTGNSSYARTKRMVDSASYCLLLHRIIMNPAPDMQVDHINGNGLDNRKCNLRICTQKENIRNSRKKSNSLSSKYKGVCWKTREGKWWSSIIVDGHRKHLGYFTAEIDAAIAYNKAASIYFGEFARLNEVVGVGL